MSREQRHDLAVMTGVLLVAALLRIVGISFGQPDPQYHPSYAPHNMVHEALPAHPDEYLYISIPTQMAVEGYLNPQFYANPSFTIYLLYAHIKLTGVDATLAPDVRRANGDVQAPRRYAPFSLYVVGRAHSALGSLLAVAATFAAGRLIAGRLAGFVAAALVAASFVLVQHAHYATTSSIASGLAAVSVWASLAALYRPHTRLPLLLASGIAIGLASSSRYNAAAASIVLCLVGLLLIYRARDGRWVALRDVMLGWGAFPVAFVLGTPGAIVAFDEFWAGFTWAFAHYAAETGLAHTSTPAQGLFLELRHLALFGLGAPAALCAVLGLGVAWWQRPRKTPLKRNSVGLACLILLAYLVPYAWVVLRTVNVFIADQMLLVIIPQVALFAGVGAAWLSAQLPLSSHTLRGGVVSIGLLLVPLSLSAQLLAYSFVPIDTRYQMQAWLVDHLPRGADIHLVGGHNVPLDPLHFRWEQTYVGPVDLAMLRARGVAYVLVSDAQAHTILRSAGYTNPALIDQTRDQHEMLVQYPDRVHEIPRVGWAGYDWPLNNATYWHQPGLMLLCLTPAACEAVSTTEGAF